MITPFERFIRFFQEPAQSGGQKPLAIEGLWLRREGDKVIVLVQIDGQWTEVIRESAEGPFSHTVAPNGIRRRLAGEVVDVGD